MTSARLVGFSFVLLLGCGSASTTNYQDGGLWRISTKVLRAPTAVGQVAPRLETECRPTISDDARPKEGKPVEGYSPDRSCRIAAVSAEGQPFERLDKCFDTTKAEVATIQYSGTVTHDRYNLVIRTSDPRRPEVVIVVQESGQLIGACPS